MKFYSIYSRFIAELNYSQSEIANKFRDINLKPLVKSLSHKSLSFEIAFKVENLPGSLRAEISNYEGILNKYHFETKAIINGLEAFQTVQEEIGVFKSVFRFPSEIKTACIQYLIYFTEFLNDMGIKSTSSLNDNVGEIMFSVTPTNDVEALDKIRQALAIYLNLPASSIVYDNSFEATRLKKEIDSLHFAQNLKELELRSSQYALRLAQQSIEGQDKIIQQKDSTIEQQQKIIEKITSPTLMMDSLDDKDKEELEEVYDGLKIGESEFLKKQLGIHLNPATFIKSIVKNTIGKEDENKSILDLDEDDEK